MIKTKIVALLGLLAVASFAAQAADGTITITGKIDPLTCSINGTTPNGAVNKAVLLPTVGKNSLMAGQTAGSTAFQITIGGPAETGCTNGKDVSLYFEAGAGVEPGTGLLSNTAPAGKSNVKVAILNTDSTRIAVGTATPNNKGKATITGNQAVLNYLAAYYADGVDATEGAVQSAVNFSVVYN